MKILVPFLLLLFAAPSWATITYVAQAENSNAAGLTSLAMTSTLTLVAGDIVEIDVAANPGSAAHITISDGLGNSSAVLANSCLSAFQFYNYIETVTTGGTATITVTDTSAGLYGVYAKQIRGASPTVIGNNCTITPGPGTGANGIVSGNVSVGSTQNIFVSGFAWNSQSGTPQQTAGTSPLAFTGRTLVWANFGVGTAFGLPEDINVSGASGNYQATAGVSGGGVARYDTMYASVVVYAQAAVGPPASFNMFLAQ